MFARLARRFLEWFAPHLPLRKIIGGDEALYLSRYTLFDFPWSKRRIYLHRFHRSDEDRDLHNHPWTRSYSLVLLGGYREERLQDGKVIVRDVYPGSINVIDPNTFHRVDLLNGDAWTIFFTGTLLQDWGFWDRDTNKFVDHKTYLLAKGLLPFEGEDY